MGIRLAQVGPGSDRAPAGFVQLYRDLYRPMVKVAYLLTGNGAIAEELVQDAFIRVHLRWADVRQPTAYLHRTVVNACRSHHRRWFLERRHPPEPEGVTHQPELDETWALLQHLTPRRRTALVLRFYEDLPVADIAEIMQCSEGTVKSLIHRGLAQLRGVMT